MKLRKRIVKLLLAVTVLQLIWSAMGTSKPQSVNASTWGKVFSTDAFISKAIDKAIMLYGPGSYMSKNGRACTCHNKGIRCEDSPSNCNCLRYVMIDGVRCDLCAVQCMGYATYFQQVLFGCNEFTASSKFKVLSGVSGLDAKKAKNWFISNIEVLHPGTHIRVNWGQHSIVFMGADFEKGTITYIDCNWVGRCKVSDFTTLTWKQFVDKYHSINYAKVYKNYYSYFEGAPDPAKVRELQKQVVYYTPTPVPPKASPTSTPKPATYIPGVYKVVTNGNSNLNLRADTNTRAEVVSSLPNGTEVTVKDFEYNINGYHWGLVPFADGTGWVAMQFLQLVGHVTPTPTPAPIPPTREYSPGIYSVNTDGAKLRVRAEGSAQSAILKNLNDKSEILIDAFVGGVNNDWGRVKVDNTRFGWVAMDYVTLKVRHTPTPTPALPTAAVTNTPTPKPTATPTPTVTPTPTSAAVVPTGESGSATPEISRAVDTNTAEPTLAVNAVSKNETKKAAQLSSNAIIGLIVLGCVGLEVPLYLLIKRRHDRKWKNR